MEGFEKKVTQKVPIEVYESLWGGGEPDAFSLLANGVRQVGTVGRWKTGGYADTGRRGDINGSHAGMVVIRELQKNYFPEAKVIVNSYNEEEESWPEERHAEVAASEFTATGIPEENIIVQEESFSTFTELLETIKLAEENKWKKVVIVTNGAQAGRARAMLEHIDIQQSPDLRRIINSPVVQGYLLPFLERRQKGEVMIAVIAAEDVLEKMSERHADLVARVRKTVGFKESKERQDATISSLEEGTYGLHKTNTTVNKKDNKLNSKE